ncbi:MAG: AAA family ATPase [Planctomycetes bacterium]|nr:AAA family ATPase [Planctomycetota bacterium]
MRVDILAAQCPEPRSAEPDEISASLHAVAVGLVDLGGVVVLDNAAAVLAAVIAGWPEHLRPDAASVAKAAAWVIRQDASAPRADAPSAEPLRQRIEQAIAGQLVAVPWPWPSVSGLTQALLPGAVTLLVGSPGATKSFWILQAALWWRSEGWRVAMYELEEDAAFWLARALALAAGIGSFTDPAWIAANAERARGLLADHRQALDDLAACITCAPPQGIDLRGLGDWIDNQAKSGARVICADPITAASVGDGKPWLAAESFMLRAKRAAVKHGASLVLTSHGRKQSGPAKGPPDLDSLAGGAAYARFASTVLWLEAMEAESVPVVTADGSAVVASCNRRLRVLKARSGRGTGLAIGLHFDGSTLRTAEAGIIATPAKQTPRPAADHGRGSRLRQRPHAGEDVFPEG